MAGSPATARAAVDAMLAQITREVAALPEAHILQLAPIMAEARRELGTKLATWLREHPDGGERFTAQRYREAMLQLDTALKVVRHRLPAEMLGLLGEQGDAAAALALKNLKKQVLMHAKHFGGETRALPFRTAALVERGTALLMPRYRQTLERYGAEGVQLIQRQLAVGFMQGETFHELTRRLVKQAGGVMKEAWGADEAAQKIAGGFTSSLQSRAERIVRTEGINTYNSLADQGIDDLELDDPGWMKKWDAAQDRVCPVCRGLDGNLVIPGGGFAAPPDEQGVVRTHRHPPAHPNCRCALVAWRREWERVLPQREKAAPAPKKPKLVSVPPAKPVVAAKPAPAPKAPTAPPKLTVVPPPAAAPKVVPPAPPPVPAGPTPEQLQAEAQAAAKAELARQRAEGQRQKAEAAEQARRQAEVDARAAAQKAEIEKAERAEAARLAREKAAAEKAAAAEAAAKAKAAADAEAKAAAERVRLEKEQAAVTAKAEKERIAAEQRKQQEAEKARLAAAEAERARAAEAARKAGEERQRAEDAARAKAAAAAAKAEADARAKAEAEKARAAAAAKAQADAERKRLEAEAKRKADEERKAADAAKKAAEAAAKAKLDENAANIAAVKRMKSEPLATTVHARMDVSGIAEKDRALFAAGVFSQSNAKVSLEEMTHAFAPPEGFIGKVTEVTPTRIKVMYLDKEGRFVGNLQRDFRVGREIHHTYFVLSPDHRGGGFSDTINGQAMLRYEKWGLKKISVDAAWVGRYAWARMGFTFKQHEQVLKPALNFIKKKVPAAKRAEYTAKLHELIKQPWKLAKWDEGEQYEVEFENVGKQKQKGSYSIGKAILLHGDVPVWDGEMPVGGDDGGYLTALRLLKVAERK